MLIPNSNIDFDLISLRVSNGSTLTFVTDPIGNLIGIDIIFFVIKAVIWFVIGMNPI